MTIRTDEYAYRNTDWSQSVKTDANGNERIVHEHATSGQQFVEREDGTLESTALDTGQISVEGAQSIAVSTGNVVRSDGEQFSFQGSSAEYSDFGAAFNAAAKVNSTIYLPPVTVDYSTGMTITEAEAPMEVRGAGKWSTGLRYTGSNDALLIKGDGGNASGISISDFSLLGNGTAGQKGLHQTVANNGKVVKFNAANIGICGFDSYGIHENEGTGGQMWDWDYYNIGIADIGDHAYFTPDPVPQRRCILLKQSTTSMFKQAFGHTDNNNGNIQGNFISDKGTDWNIVYDRVMAEYQVNGVGMNVIGTNGIQIVNSNFEGNGSYGLRAKNVDNFTIANNKVSGSTDNGFQLDSGNGVSNGFIFGNRFLGVSGSFCVSFALSPFENIYMFGNEIGPDGSNRLWKATANFDRFRFGKKKAISANTTLAEEETDALVDSSSGAYTVTIPSAAVKPNGRMPITIVDSGGNAGTNAITINAENETINGATSVQITTNYGVAQLHTDGTNWFADI